MQTFEKFIRIIELLEENNNLRLKDISSTLNLNNSTVHRFLKIMLKNGLIKKDEDTGRYSLGLRFLNIATKIIDFIDIRETAHPYLVELKNLTGETVHLTTFDGKNVVYIDKIESDSAIRMYSKIGNIAPIYCTGVGKATLAFQPEEKINEILESLKYVRYTKNTITDEKMLKECIGDIRKQGYAVDNAEHENGIICIAAPVRDYSKRVFNSISISALASRMNISDLISSKDILIEKCNLISEKMGYLK